MSLVLFKLLLFSSLLQVTLQFDGFVIEKLTCNATATICTNPICDLTAPKDKPQEYHMTFGCTLLKTVNKLFVRFRTFKKVGRRFKLTSSAHVEFNLCQVSKMGLNPIVSQFVPALSNQMGRLFHECPYKDKFLVEDMTIDGAVMPLVFNKRQIKSEVVFVSGTEDFLAVVMFGKTGESVIDI